MFSFIDAHCHIYSEDFDEDRHAVIEKAKQAGVKSAVVVAENTENFQAILDLHERYPDFCAPAFGVHPVQGDYNSLEARSVAHEDLDKALPLIEQHHEKLVAIGECGLDFTPKFVKSDQDKNTQREVLIRQVELAKKYDLPLNVHSRSAGRPTIQLLKENGAKHVLLHAFDGKAAVAMNGVECGFFFSIPPSVARSDQVKLIERVPLENMLLETDSPALGPEKQVRNEPSNIRVSCEYIAKIKKVDAETVARVTTENALRLFPRLRTMLPK